MRAFLLPQLEEVDTYNCYFQQDDEVKKYVKILNY